MVFFYFTPIHTRNTKVASIKKNKIEIFKVEKPVALFYFTPIHNVTIYNSTIQQVDINIKVLRKKDRNSLHRN